MDETKQMLGRIQATLEHQNDMLDELKAEMREVHAATAENGEVTRANARHISIVETKIEEHRAHDEKIAKEIGGTLAPVVKHVTVWNGVTRVVLIVIGAGSAAVAAVRALWMFIFSPD